MKNLLKLLLLLTTVCSSKLVAQVKYERSPASGAITVTSFGFGKNRAISGADATSAALNTLLFVGIPGSAYELPLVADEAKKENPAVKNLFDGGYSDFITEVVLLDEAKTTKKIDGVAGKSAQYRLTINVDALRRYLEKNNVIRKFGL